MYGSCWCCCFIDVIVIPIARQDVICCRPIQQPAALQHKLTKDIAALVVYMSGHVGIWSFLSRVFLPNKSPLDDVLSPLIVYRPLSCHPLQLYATGSTRQPPHVMLVYGRIKAYIVVLTINIEYMMAVPLTRAFLPDCKLFQVCNINDRSFYILL